MAGRVTGPVYVSGVRGVASNMRLAWILVVGCGGTEGPPAPPPPGSPTGPDVGACAVEPGRGRIEGDRSAADASARWEGFADAAVGFAIGSPGDVDGDGLDDLLIGSTTHDAGGAAAGALLLFHGPFAGRATSADADARFLGAAGDNVGWLVTAVGDVDGDGVADVAGQTHRHADGAGLAFVSFGPAAGDTVVTDADVVIRGDAERGLGLGLAGLGDVNGDGRGDLAVGAALVGEGTAWIWHDGLVAGTWSEADANAGFTGEPDGGDVAGAVLAGPGDLDGDGLGDALIADYGHARARGRVYEVHAPFSGLASLDQAAASVSGSQDGAYLGVRLAAGDLDGDCVPDAVVLQGGPAAVLVFGGGLGRAAAPDDADARVQPAGGPDSTLAVPGDLDGDGFDELLLGHAAAASPAGGGAWLLYGPIVGGLGLDDADARFLPTDPLDRVGTGVAGAGDTDGDGFPEVLVGAGGASELRGLVTWFGGAI